MSRLLLLAALVLGLAGYGLYQQHCQEVYLTAQLHQLHQAVDLANTNARRDVEQALRGLQEAVAKNRNAPPDLAILAKATRLHGLATALADSLHSYCTALRSLSDYPEASASYAIRAKTQLLGAGSRSRQRLQQQVACYAATLASLVPPATAQFATPTIDHQPVVAALADVTHLENQVLTTDITAIQQLAKTVGAAPLRSQLVAVASAEANVVAPGTTYRARLLLVKSLLPQTIRMTCNGQPIPIGTNGAGLVRFRAPGQPGPASWVGQIRLSQNGRDTTFAVRVPYRVVRR
jgi:hypothetical protein